jgi:hypothetical protein
MTSLIPDSVLLAEKVQTGSHVVDAIGEIAAYRIGGTLEIRLKTELPLARSVRIN